MSDPNPSPDPPAGYVFQELCAQGSRTLVYRGVRGADGQRVFIKLPRPGTDGTRARSELLHEFQVGQRLDSPSAVRPYALEGGATTPALILEDFGGESLRRRADGQRMEVGDFLPLATRISHCVADLHARGLLHRDLKSDNLIVHPTTGEVKVADFGLATFLTDRGDVVSPDAPIVGSLPYLSPEQTGRTGRPVDARADLYALGVVFYELLTGQLPFVGRDALEWLHLHLAATPVSLSHRNAEVPPVLSEIVLKLLAKLPEERYQSAAGLQLDLQTCLEAWASKGQISSFALAQGDVPDGLALPHHLYGREEQLAELLAVFGRVSASGVPEMTLVSGPPGIGKSALVDQLRGPVATRGGFFISGKFDQYGRGIPYSTLAQAFRELVQGLLASSEDALEAWKRSLAEAVGPNGRLSRGRTTVSSEGLGREVRAERGAEVARRSAGGEWGGTADEALGEERT